MERSSPPASVASRRGKRHAPVHPAVDPLSIIVRLPHQHQQQPGHPGSFVINPPGQTLATPTFKVPHSASTLSQHRPSTPTMSIPSRRIIRHMRQRSNSDSGVFLLHSASVPSSTIPSSSLLYSSLPYQQSAPPAIYGSMQEVPRRASVPFHPYNPSQNHPTQPRRQCALPSPHQGYCQPASSVSNSRASSFNQMPSPPLQQAEPAAAIAFRRATVPMNVHSSGSTSLARSVVTNSEARPAEDALMDFLFETVEPPEVHGLPGSKLTDAIKERIPEWQKQISDVLCHVAASSNSSAATAH